jgi:hypothetical protein
MLMSIRCAKRFAHITRRQSRGESVVYLSHSLLALGKRFAHLIQGSERMLDFVAVSISGHVRFDKLGLKATLHEGADRWMRK